MGKSSLIFNLKVPLLRRPKERMYDLEISQVSFVIETNLALSNKIGEKKEDWKKEFNIKELLQTNWYDLY